jgi:Flp pilus assembly protein TadD
VVGYCDVRSGRPRAAIPAIQKAISLDPENWNFHYDLAVVRASAGLDPRAAIGQAVGLDPRERLVLQAVRVFRRGGRKQWQRDGSTIAAGFTSL